MDFLETYLPVLTHEVRGRWGDLKRFINKSSSHLEPWQIIFLSISSTILLITIWNYLFKRNQSLWGRIKSRFFSMMRNLPIIKGKIEKIMSKQYKELEEMFQKTNKGMPYITKLPQKGLSEKQVLAKLDEYKQLVDIDWREGACSGSVYSGEQDMTTLITKVYENFAWSNPLHADVFCDVRKMEVEVIRMTLDLFNGGPDACGSMTTGGTESIILACYAYRNRAYDMGIEYPEIVLPITAHPAFDKAAHMFNIKLVHTAFNKKTYKADVQSMKKAINKNTCLLVCSAPHFPHGIIDPVSDISKLASHYNLPLHVDCCLGGFILPFMTRAGYPVEPFDFSLEGVTSISADTHKYGLAPKGSSVVMYKHKEYRKHQYFIILNWPGGIYASPTLLGSRAGSSIAATWASLMYTGLEGYINVTRNIISTTKSLEKGVNNIHGVHALKSETCVLVIASEHFNIYRLSDALAHKKWCPCPLQKPSFIHMAITLIHTKKGVAERFLKDVADCVAEIMKTKDAKTGGTAAIYGMAQSIPDVSLVAEVTRGYFDAYYSSSLST